MTTVVLLVGGAGGPASAGGALREQLTDRLGECRIAVIAPVGSSFESPADDRVDVRLASTRTDVLLARTGIVALDGLLRRSAPGRLISSLGPLTPARVLRRAIRGNSHAVELLRDADVVIALDAGGVLAAWDATRHGRRTRAFSGLGPALTVLGR